MSDDAEPEFPQEEEGGPRKSFWEHLQDLRTALLRSAIVVGAFFIICFPLGGKLVGILEYPLRRMDMFERPHASVTLEIGDSKIGPFTVTRDQFPALPPGAAPHAVFRIGSAQVGSQQVVTLVPDAAATAAQDPLQVRLHNLSPVEAFSVAFQVAIYGALALASPFWIYFLGGFIVPALNLRERRLMFPWLAWSVVLFLAGILSTYFFLLPAALRASVKYSGLLGFEAADWQADQYISFVSKFLLGMGIGFQFPLVVLILVKLGVVTHKQLAHYRRHVIVLSLILGALLTTPEPLTQIAMAVPLYLLYEICVWIAWYWDWKQRRRGEPAN